ncbi:hypothetical protein J4760_06500 [Salinicoccus sp. ID82-1]|uniref:DUF5996 family protein n=1 Tax=Salinicoccus sp. ID82-1 TaxID=2820269 RepID=UPI001F2672F9|nr:DUF5996 family protein [Salinicoccus sp. ID82-1]MCG1009667.1 hypothetical protein [Salinicoccus sp. ID82-1]
MSFHQENMKEITTLQLVSQIIGKIKLEYAHQQPQWAHVVLDITPRGFTTGLLKQNGEAFSIEADLMHNRVVIETASGDETVALEDGKTVRTYYEEIIAAARRLGLDLSVFTTPQEMKTTTPFELDDEHHHYKPEVSREILAWFQYASDTEAMFLAPLRIRKAMPGLFWGTFDVSCFAVYDQFEPFPDDTKVIERAAFDEHMIEFGFWLGDDTFKDPPFFVLPYPFVSDTVLEVDDSFPEGSYFKAEMTEYLYEMKNGRDEQEKEKIAQFFRASFVKSRQHLGWDNQQHCFNSLKMNDNKR